MLECVSGIRVRMKSGRRDPRNLPEKGRGSCEFLFGVWFMEQVAGWQVGWLVANRLNCPRFQAVLTPELSDNSKQHAQRPMLRWSHSFHRSTIESIGPIKANLEVGTSTIDTCQYCTELESCRLLRSFLGISKETRPGIASSVSRLFSSFEDLAIAIIVSCYANGVHPTHFNNDPSTEYSRFTTSP